MSYLKTIEIKNGKQYYPLEYYTCNICEEEISEKHPHYSEGNDYYLCLECALKNNKISEKFYIQNNGIDLDNVHASIHNEEIVLHQGKPPWKRGAREIRNSKKYSKWRTKVFERDNYTCQKCGQIGGELNAHHIKEFSNYPTLRFKLSNGLTSCEDCHRKEHWGD